MSRLRHDETRDHVDVLESLDAISPPRVRVLTLVHYGADENQEKFIWDIDKTVAIGRDPGEEGIELLDPSSSRRHAEITFDDERDSFSVRDLGSRNGTFVDGTRTAEAELEHGTVIRIADSILVFAEVAIPEGLTCPAAVREVSLVRSVAEARADIAARAPLSILILGPTGAGKEVMAQRIHDASGRSGRLVAINCGALNRELISSELFGHAAGAFSGANSDRAGLFVAANKGTLFLDEIADLPLDQQPALLRTLQEKRVRPVGSDRETPVDVRVIAATHRPLQELVQSDIFRRDLYARLSGLVVELPGLAQRREEVIPFFTELSGVAPERISPDAAEALVLHEWPENVREVQHLAAQVKMYKSRDVLELNALPAAFGERLTWLRKKKPDVAPSSKKLDRDVLMVLLQDHQGNVATIAKTLGKHRAQVYRWLRKEGLNPDDYREPEA